MPGRRLRVAGDTRRSKQFVNVLLSSAGRRPYLVDWFKDALRDNEVSGRIVVVDADEYAASRERSDLFVVAPLVTDPEYDDWLATLLIQQDIDLAISINDFELSAWSHLPDSFPRIDRLLRLNVGTQRVIEDKVLTAKVLLEHDVRIPRTVTATEALDELDPASERAFVTKGRFGSASRGLRMTTARSLREAAHEAAKEVTDARGRLTSEADPQRLDLVVVQDYVHGVEYGLDVVSDFEGRYAGTLARRKIAMRGGETDRAESVDAAPFESLGRQIASAVPHRGSFDIDVIVDAEGAAWVIDINPRLGGGYPFSHLAGARTPAAYIAWVTGEKPDPAWLVAEPGVVGSKYVGVARSI